MIKYNEKTLGAVMNMTCPVAALADLHIKRRAWNNWAALQGDKHRALAEAGDFLSALSSMRRKTGRPPVQTVLAGDIFDATTAAPCDVHAVAEFCKKTGEVCYILGNHDPVTPSYMESIQGTVHLDKTTPISLSGSSVFGVDHTSSAYELLNSLDTVYESWNRHYSDTRLVVVLHQACQHLLGLEGQYQCTERDILEHLGPDPIVVVGHVHKFDCRPLSGQSGLVLSPGTLFVDTWQGAELPHCLVIFDGVTGCCETFPIIVRQYKTVSVTSLKQAGDALQEAVARRDPDLLPPAIRLVLPDDLHIPDGFSFPEELVVQIVQENSAEEQRVIAAPEKTSILQAVLDDLRSNFTGDDAQLLSDLEALATELLASPDALDCLYRHLKTWQCKLKPFTRRRNAADQT